MDFIYTLYCHAAEKRERGERLARVGGRLLGILGQYGL
jgi:hypothetical protein